MALDDGFKLSDKELRQLEKKIHKEYSQATKEMAEKTEKYFDKFAKQDEIKRQAYEAGKISKKEYAQWRQNKMLTGERWQAMRDTLATDLSNYDKIAMRYVRDTAIDVYALNMNYGTYALEKASGINTSFTLYNHDAVKVLLKDNPQLLPKYANPKVNIPLDKRWNMQHINSAITQGILQGESIPQVAKRLENVVGMDERAAIRNARTAMTSAQSAGRLDAAKRMAARGVGVKKGWLATLDNVTRDSHVDVDGEVVDLDKNFSNGLQYPADGAGAPEEVYNCRCRLTTEYDKYKTNWSDTTLRNTDKFKAESYDAWKKAAKDRLEKKAQKKMVAKSEAEKVMIVNTLTMPVRPRKADFENEDMYYEAREKYREERNNYKKQRDNLVEQMMQNDRKYNTVDDLKKWAEQNNVFLKDGIDKAVDPNLYNDVLGALDEMFAKYPEVKDMFNQYGFNLAFTDTLEYVAEANGGLRLGGIFKDARGAYTDVFDMQAKGFLTRASGDLKSVIRHEYGHNADTYIKHTKFGTLDSTHEWKVSGKLDRRNEAARQYEKELIDITIKHGSEYSRTNTAEAFAEGFAEYTSNPNSAYGKAFGEFFERWYNANPIE